MHLSLTTSHCSKCQLVMNSKFPRVSWTGFPADLCYPRPCRLSKTWLDQALSNLVWSHSWPCPEQEVGPKTAWGSFLLNFSWDLFDLLPKTKALLTIYYPSQQVLTSPAPVQGFWNQFTSKAQQSTLLQPGKPLDQGSPNGPHWRVPSTYRAGRQEVQR